MNRQGTPTKRRTRKPYWSESWLRWEYLQLAVERINTPLVKPESKRVESLPGQMELFA